MMRTKVELGQMHLGHYLFGHIHLVKEYENYKRKNSTRRIGCHEIIVQCSINNNFDQVDRNDNRASFLVKYGTLSDALVFRP